MLLSRMLLQYLLTCVDEQRAKKGGDAGAMDDAEFVPRSLQLDSSIVEVEPQPGDSMACGPASAHAASLVLVSVPQSSTSTSAFPLAPWAALRVQSTTPIAGDGGRCIQR